MGQRPQRLDPKQGMLRAMSRSPRWARKGGFPKISGRSTGRRTTSFPQKGGSTRSANIPRFHPSVRRSWGVPLEGEKQVICTSWSFCANRWSESVRSALQTSNWIRISALRGRQNPGSHGRRKRVRTGRANEVHVQKVLSRKKQWTKAFIRWTRPSTPLCKLRWTLMFTLWKTSFLLQPSGFESP